MSISLGSMSDTVSVKCNVCEFDDTEHVSDKGQFNLPLSVVICKNCGLTYLNPRWTKEKYLKFYQEDYDKYYRPNMKTDDRVTEAASNPIILRIKERELFRKEAQHILDIGSGEGNNLKALRQVYKKARFYAIEPSPEAQESLKREHVEILHHDVDGDWDTTNKGKFDLIVMRHVLEHMMDPVETLKKIASCLSENGVFYVAVPNCLNPTAELESKWFRTVHTYYFNKYSLANALKKAQLHPIHAIEGDKYERREIFILAKKPDQPLDMHISSDHFMEQQQVFTDRLKVERSLINVLKRKVTKVFQDVRHLSD